MDDSWEVGARYRGEMDGFRLAAAIVVRREHHDADGGGSYAFACLAEGGAPGASGNESCSQLGASASLMHDPTGLYANLAYGTATDNFIGAHDQFRKRGGR